MAFVPEGFEIDGSLMFGSDQIDYTMRIEPVSYSNDSLKISYKLKDTSKVDFMQVTFKSS
jgi:hypothetical protein